jgi:hypothetical protein
MLRVIRMTELNQMSLFGPNAVANSLTRVWGNSRCPGRAAFGYIVEVVVADARQEKTRGLAGSSSHDDVTAVGRAHDRKPQVWATRSVGGERRVACPGRHVGGRCVWDAGRSTRGVPSNARRGGDPRTSPRGARARRCA